MNAGAIATALRVAHIRDRDLNKRDNLPSRLQQRWNRELARVDRKLSLRMRRLEAQRAALNERRRPEDQINWDDAAESYPTENSY